MIYVGENLLTGNSNWLKGITDNFNTQNYFSPFITIVIVIVVINIIGFAVWFKWHRRMETQPDAKGLLMILAQKLNLEKPQWKLLAKISRDINFEPSAALVSPAMLELLVDRWQQNFGEMSDGDMEHIQHIRRAIRRSGQSGGQSV